MYKDTSYWIPVAVINDINTTAQLIKKSDLEEEHNYYPIENLTRDMILFLDCNNILNNYNNGIKKTFNIKDTNSLELIEYRPDLFNDIRYFV